MLDGQKDVTNTIKQQIPGQKWLQWCMKDLIQKLFSSHLHHFGSQVRFSPMIGGILGNRKLYCIVLYCKRSRICTKYRAQGKGPCWVAPHSPNLMSPSSGSRPSSATSFTMWENECSPRALKERHDLINLRWELWFLYSVIHNYRYRLFVTLLLFCPSNLSWLC